MNVIYHFCAKRSGFAWAILSLVITCPIAPAFAQQIGSFPQGTPTAAAAENLNKHVFNRGESIYASPDPDRILRFPGVSRDKAAITELADLVVAYKDIDDKDSRGMRSKETAEARKALGIRKVEFYARYNLSSALLQVQKPQMPAYVAFWKDFWVKVADFKKNNPNISGPGPYTLSNRGTLAAIVDGATTRVQRAGKALWVQDASAELSRDYPACGYRELYEETPIKEYPETKEYLFYFSRDIQRNYNGQSGNKSPYTEHEIKYVDITYYYGSTLKKGANVNFSEFWKEVTWCGTDAGDNSGKISRSKWFDSDCKGKAGGCGKDEAILYCLDSKDSNFQRYQKSFVGIHDLDEQSLGTMFHCPAWHWQAGSKR